MMQGTCTSIKRSMGAAYTLTSRFLLAASAAALGGDGSGRLLHASRSSRTASMNACTSASRSASGRAAADCSLSLSPGGRSAMACRM